MSLTFQHCYLNNSLQIANMEEMLCEFENKGHLSVSLVKQLQRLSVSENNTIFILRTLIDTNKHKIKNKIVNSTTDSKYNTKSNNKDQFRKAFGVNFDNNADDVNTTLADDLLRLIWNEIVTMGIVDPQSKPTNGNGNWGVDLLDKDYGCGVQLKHFDYPQYLHSLDFKSFQDTMKNEEKRSAYNTSCDGGISVFVNPYGYSDYLQRGDGSFIEIPPYSYLILRGNVIHCGTGNFSHYDGIYKIFFYGDPPNYNRKDSDNQYRVFLPGGHEYHTVIRDKHSDEVTKIVIIPSYTCLNCGKSARYTHPYCKQCLEIVWRLQLTFSNKTTTIEYIGNRLLEGFEFPVNIWGDLVTNAMYRKIHSDLQGEIIVAFQLCDESGQLIDLYLDCFYKRSFLASIEITLDDTAGNVQLKFNRKTRTVSLICICDVPAHSRLVLYVKKDYFKNQKYYLDIEEYAIQNAMGV